MKKNLFLLFSIYFFVLQPLIIWVLRGQANFFRLGAINLIAIILIGLLYNTVENEKKEDHQEHEKKQAINKEAKVSFHDQFRAAVKERKKKWELISPTIISFLVAIIIFFMFQYNSAAIEVMLLFAFVLGFIVFLSLTLIMKHRITKSFRALLWTKIYLILLIVSLALTVYDYYQVRKDFNATFQDYIAQNFLGQERIPTDGYIFTGEGTVLGTGIWGTTTTQEVSSDIFTGMAANSDVQEVTGTILWASVDTLNTSDVVAPTSIGNQKIMDAIIYLIKKYEIPLNTKKDISFTYVSIKNPYYTEWRTAYANKMIGKTTNPSKYIVCESYIVMKWLLEKWPVTYTSTTVLTKFRAEAVKRDTLNGCVKGKIVTDKTL